MDKKCGHAKNEIIYVQLSTIIILRQLNLGQEVEDKQKLVQFAIVFNILSKGKPIIDYEDFNLCSSFLNLDLCPKKHWFNGAGWKMAKHIDHEVKKKLKLISKMPSLYLLLVMELHPWTMQVEQVSMVMLCKIGVNLHCC